MRWAKTAIVLAFLLLLGLPALQMATRALAVPPLDENRNLAKLPALSGLRHPSALVAALQAWFDDHYGFRELLIRAKAQMDFSLFGTSERVHIGRNGFLFYRQVIDQQEPQIEQMSDADLDQALHKIAAIRDYLAPRGIHLIVQTEQLKDKFYPEYLPRQAQFARSRHRFDDFRAKLTQLPGLTYLDTTPVLLRLKAERPIFHRTDFHWNDPAAFVCAENLVNTIASLEGRQSPLWDHKLQIEQRRFSGGQALFMPLFRPPSEMALFVKPEWDQSVDATDYNASPFEFVMTRRPPLPPDLLPPTVVFGDSFNDGEVRSGVATYFRRYSFARLYKAELADVLQALPPDTKYFVLEFIEVALPSLRVMNLPGAGHA